MIRRYSMSNISEMIQDINTVERYYYPISQMVSFPVTLSGPYGHDVLRQPNTVCLKKPDR